MKKDSRIYIAGHTGQIGYGLAKKLQADGYENVILRTHDSLDLLDQKSVWDFFEKEKPEYVFYCAGTLGTIDYFVQEKAAVIYRAEWRHTLVPRSQGLNCANNIMALLGVNVSLFYLRMCMERRIFLVSRTLWLKSCCKKCTRRSWKAQKNLR